MRTHSHTSTVKVKDNCHLFIWMFFPPLAVLEREKEEGEEEGEEAGMRRE